MILTPLTLICTVFVVSPHIVTGTGTLNIGTPSLPCPAGKGPTTVVLFVLTHRLLVGAYYDFCISIRTSSLSIHAPLTFVQPDTQP
jgi:hypothetical protein